MTVSVGRFSFLVGDFALWKKFHFLDDFGATLG
jgi:hypothetical protein